MKRIKQITELLNRQGYGVDPSIYSAVQDWQEWWAGHYAPFHTYIERSGGVARERKLYSMGMAKKVCEDWASILLNEKTQIQIEDEHSRLYILGEDEHGGVYGDNRFWERANALIERTFATGTGAIIVKIKDLEATEQGEVIRGGGAPKVKFDYISATQIFPITIEDGDITEAAFASTTRSRGQEKVYLEIHEKTRTGYKITNGIFTEKGDKLVPDELDEDVAREINIQTKRPLFVIIKPNIQASTSRGGLGTSVFANAIDNLIGTDLAFNNFCRDLKLGGKKVFYSDSLIQRDAQGNTIAPDDVMQQLFVQVGEPFLSENGVGQQIQEFNPSLRVEENRQALQAQLDYLSFKVGLGTKHYQFNAGQIVTATQYSGDKQELVQNAAKHYIPIERALIDLTRVILEIAHNLFGLQVDPDCGITVQFEDGYIIDKETERTRDLIELRDGVITAWEYRAKWYGEDEETARVMAYEAGQRTDDEIMGFYRGIE